VLHPQGSDERRVCLYNNIMLLAKGSDILPPSVQIQHSFTCSAVLAGNLRVERVNFDLVNRWRNYWLRVEQFLQLGYC
jgi:hypothetical protein